MARKKKIEDQITDAVTVKGNHLTVTTHPDGRTELVWDDEALLKEVREAIESYEISQLKPNVKAKVVTRRKKTKE